MSQIKHLHIKNFRSIKNLEWTPKPGLNCLIGSGDSGKSTILDAIDLVLSARRTYTFTDADFYQSDTTNPIEISATIGNLEEELKNYEVYGSFLRDFNSSNGSISDEPNGGEIVLTIKLMVAEDLEATWQLHSERGENAGQEQQIRWKHRELIAPIRLGVVADYHLAWGNRSVLNKLTDGNINVATLLATISRNAREAFTDQAPDENVSHVLQIVEEIANNLAVPVRGLKASLDVNSVSLSKGAIGLHQGNIPLRQLGTGSARLLITGLQKASRSSSILIIDEAEYGLEPFRITRLLNELGSKDNGATRQVFITTHSPYVLRELQAQQLHVVRKLEEGESNSHHVHKLNGRDDEQSTLRVCAEAFFSRAVIVAEGKTEIGIIRGLDLYLQDQKLPSIFSTGIYYADGTGDNFVKRAKIFDELRYPTVILKDSDKETQSTNLQVFEWGNNWAFEDALFSCCPNKIIQSLLEIAIERKGTDAINQHISNYSETTLTLDSYSDQSKITLEMRTVLAKAACKKSWYKDIEPAEMIARTIIGPHLAEFDESFQKVLNNLLEWVKQFGSGT